MIDVQTLTTAFVYLTLILLPNP